VFRYRLRHESTAWPRLCSISVLWPADTVHSFLPGNYKQNLYSRKKRSPARLRSVVSCRRREWVRECLRLRDLPQPTIPTLGSEGWTTDGKVQVSIAINMDEIRNRSLLYRRGLDRNLPYGFICSAVHVGLVIEQVILGLQFFFQVLWFFRANVIPPFLRITVFTHVICAPAYFVHPNF
jgi:hypothetical protein